MLYFLPVIVLSKVWVSEGSTLVLEAAVAHANYLVHLLFTGKETAVFAVEVSNICDMIERNNNHKWKCMF